MIIKDDKYMVDKNIWSYFFLITRVLNELNSSGNLKIKDYVNKIF